MSTKTLFFLLLSLVLSCTHAVAQNANDIIRLFGGIVQNAGAQAALMEWKKLPEREILCVDEALHRRGSSLQTALRQGITPSDTRVADALSDCRQPTAQGSTRTVDNQASQTQQILWDHNGSSVYLVSEGRSRKFLYSEPRLGMQSAGAKAGSLIFEGEAIGQQYQGTAYLYNSRCGRLPYRVTGPILDNYRRVELRGRAPRVDNNCRVTEYVDDLLAFQLIEPNTVQFGENNRNPGTHTSEAQNSSTIPQQSNSPPPLRYPNETQGNVKPSIFPTAPTDSPIAPELRVPGATQADGARTVEVIGVAKTPETARNDAARQAVQQVAGVFVDNRRRVELKMSDEKLSAIVEEKVLSYTNAYVTKLEVLSTEHQTEGYAIRAKVTVAIAPLVKTLRDNSVPTVAFDADTAAGTAESLTDEKTNALAIYADLLARVDELVKLALGKAEVAASIPSAPGWTWISVPLTFFVNNDRLQEWRQKFDLIANRRANFSVGARIYKVSNECTVPVFDLMAHDPAIRETFLVQKPVSGQDGAAACFLSRAGPASMAVNCFGRAFVPDGRQCTSGSGPNSDPRCLSLQKSTASISLMVEFLNKEEQVIHSVQPKLSSFPALSILDSHSTPRGNETAFFNFCTGEQSIFFSASKKTVGFGPYTGPMNFGDVVTFPPVGSRINALLNVILPNEMIGQIASVRAFIGKGPRPGDASRRPTKIQ